MTDRCEPKPVEIWPVKIVYSENDGGDVGIDSGERGIAFFVPRSALGSGPVPSHAAVAALVEAAIAAWRVTYEDLPSDEMDELGDAVANIKKEMGK